MPRIALFSELHGNLEALESVLAEVCCMDGIERICCLGDFVGYGPNPNEVIDTIAALEQKGYELSCNVGNHDAAALGRCEFVDLADPDESQRVMEEGGFENQSEVLKAYRNPETRHYIPVKRDAKVAIDWTIENFTDAALNFLETRLEERTEILPGIISVHASPRDTSFEYVRDVEAAQKCFESETMNEVKICFHGHTHVPVTWSLKKDERLSYGGSIIVMDTPKENRDDKVELDLENYLYLINVGAVGQPRGDDRKPCYCIFDSDAGSVEFHKVSYDAETTKAKMRDADLPESLIDRLGRRSAQ